MDLERELELFIEQIPLEHLIQEIVSITGEKEARVHEIITMYLNESRVALNLIKESLSFQAKMLEVGSGLCFFSLFLKQQGYNITALEPSAGGFSLFHKIKNVILNYYSNLSLPVLEMTAEELTPDQGQFDLIFSNNVIEHIPQLTNALDSMLGVLAPQGKMLHGCPNYVVPYEPHFNVLVIKPIKKISELVFRKKIAQMQDIWDSLNFITHLNIKKYAKKNMLSYDFKKGLLYKALTRLEKDPHFRERHANSVFIYIYYSLKYTGLLNMLKYIPICMSTPMIFELRRQEFN